MAGIVFSVLIITVYDANDRTKRDKLELDKLIQQHTHEREILELKQQQLKER